jgi:hypothetical protein
VRRTADEIMERGGFEPTDTGPYVTELREQTRELVAKGILIDRSPGTWGPDAIDFKSGEWKIDSEARAKVLLAIEWRMQHRHAYYVECIDGPPWGWTCDTRTLKWSFRIKWHMIQPWLGDLRRLAGMRYRVWRDRYLVNPYDDVVPDTYKDERK